MCGIAFLMRKDGRPAVKQLLKTFEKQRGRGTQGFGYVAFDNGVLQHIGRATEEHDIKRQLNGATAGAILFHHRLPTSTPNFREATHPIYVNHERLRYDYYVVHNGVITNDTRLKGDHEKLGYVYTTEMMKQETWKTASGEYPTGTPVFKWNDSEALAIEVAEGIENDKARIDVWGSVAFVALQVDKNTKQVKSIYYARNTNPLKIDDNNTYFKLSSDGGGTEIETHTLYKFDVETGISTQRPFEIGSNYTKPEIGYKYSKNETPAQQALPEPKPQDDLDKTVSTLLSEADKSKSKKRGEYFALDVIEYMESDGATVSDVEKAVGDYDVWNKGFALSDDWSEDEFELDTIIDVCKMKIEKLWDTNETTAEKWDLLREMAEIRLDVLRDTQAYGNIANDDRPDGEGDDIANDTDRWSRAEVPDYRE